MSDRKPSTTHQPIQFDLSKLMQFVTIAALWCAAGIVRESITVGMAYTVLTVVATWIVVGRWAVTLSPKGCRRVLAVMTTLLVAGGFGVTLLVADEEYFPLAWMLTGLLAFSPLLFLQVGAVWGVVLGTLCSALALSVAYFAWLAVFRLWDRLSTGANQRRLTRSFSALFMLLAMPILINVSGGCYTFCGHGEDSNAIHHLWLHCAIHVGMLVAAGVVVTLLQRHGQRSITPPTWLKLLTLGYLCLYGVLLQVALFPIDFYIP